MDPIRTSSIEIVNDKGETRIKLGCDPKTGDGFIRLQNAQNETVCELRSDDFLGDGGGELTLGNKSGEPRVHVCCSDDAGSDGGTLNLLNEKTVSVATLKADQKGGHLHIDGGEIMVQDENKCGGAILASDSAGGIIKLNNISGEVVVVAETNGAGHGEFTVANAAGERRLNVAIPHQESDSGGEATGITIFRGDGSDRAIQLGTFPTSSEGLSGTCSTMMQMFDNNNAPLIAMGSSPNGTLPRHVLFYPNGQTAVGVLVHDEACEFNLFDASGECRVRTNVNSDGSGEIGKRDSQGTVTNLGIEN